MSQRRSARAIEDAGASAEGDELLAGTVEFDALLASIESTPASSLEPAVAQQIQELAPSTLADLIEASPPRWRPSIWRCADELERAESLIALHRRARAELITAVEDEELMASLAQLQADELADLEGDLPESVLGPFVASMRADQRANFETVRSFPDDCAGGLMDVDALAVPIESSIHEVQDRLRRHREREGALPEHLDCVFVVDNHERYLGRLLLSDLVSLPPGTRVEDATRYDLEPIDATLGADAVARRFEDHDLISAPVVDSEARLLGRITIDDIVDVIRGEGEEAVLSMAGLDKDVDPFGSFSSALGDRMLWIGIHLVNGLVAAGVIGFFRDSIAALVALAVLMPIVAGVGGVGGTQSLTLAMRGLALDQITPGNAGRLLRRELSVALVNGMFWSAVTATVVFFWFDDIGLALVFAAALVLNLVNGAFFGSWLPVVLPKLGIDPTVAGGVVLVAATDILGFTLFLGFAALLLL